MADSDFEENSESYAQATRASPRYNDPASLVRGALKAPRTTVISARHLFGTQRSVDLSSL